MGRPRKETPKLHPPNTRMELGEIREYYRKKNEEWRQANLIRYREYQKDYRKREKVKVNNRCPCCDKLLTPGAAQCQKAAPPPRCPECDKVISFRSKTCIKHRPKRPPNYCIDCGKEISPYRNYKRCLIHAAAWQRGRPRGKKE